MSEMTQMTFNDDPSLTGPKSLETLGTVAEENPSWSDDLDAPTRDFVQRKTDEIHGQLKRTAEGIIKIGLNLIAVKERLPHGQFLPWLKAEFDMTEMSAVRYMQVARRFGKSNTMLDFPTTVLYALAAPSTSDEIVKKVQSGEIALALDAIKAEKLAEKRRADEAERAKEVAEQQMKRLSEEVAALERLMSERATTVIENPETVAALARLREKYAQKEEQLRIKTERVAALGAELDKHAHRDEQETYRQQIRSQFRQACEAFHQGINQGMARMVTPLDAASAFEGDDWARLSEVLSTLKRADEVLISLRESVTCRVIDASVERERYP